MKTSKKHYDYFKQRCRYYQKELGLMGYSLDYLHEDIEEYGYCHADIDAKACTIKLCTDWGNGKIRPLTLCELDLLAYHEVQHLRLADLVSLAQYRYATKGEILRASEEIVTALENFHRAHY